MAWDIRQITLLILMLCTTAFAQPATQPAEKLMFKDRFDKDLAQWQPEGNHVVEASDGKLHVKTNSDEKFNGQFIWCKQKLPESFRIEYEVTPMSDSGFFLLFFCVQGVKGEDILEPELFEKYLPHKSWTQYQDWDKYTSPPNRTHESRIRGYHVSYRRNELANCNLRKNPGLILLKSSELSSRLPKGETARVSLTYRKGHILLQVNDQVFMDYTDKTDAYLGGRFGLRQVYDSEATYDNVRLYELTETSP